MIPFVVYGQFGENPPRELGSRQVHSRRTALREITELLRQIAEAFGEQATFEEIAEHLRGDFSS